MPPFSARGLTQTYSVIDAGKVQKRTINGALHDLSLPQFQKYRSTITCADHRVPALDGVFPGMQVTVSCVFELAYASGGTPQRDVVPGSAREENGFVFYRPRLVMRVIDYRIEHDEWDASFNWSLDLEEV
jgi:hypothetical protein